MISVVEAGLAPAQYSYDPFGRRISKTVNGTTTNFVYDGDQVIAEYDGSNILQKKYVYGTGIDEQVMMQSGPNKYYYNRDGLGSVSEVTDNTGAVVEKYSYGVFGRTTIKDASDNVLTQSAIGNRYGFTGRELDAETGLYHYRARAYSPELGRFLQTDPIGYVDGNNAYNYVSNNPLRYVDPYGLCRGDPNGDNNNPGGGDNNNPGNNGDDGSGSPANQAPNNPGVGGRPANGPTGLGDLLCPPAQAANNNPGPLEPASGYGIGNNLVSGAIMGAGVLLMRVGLTSEDVFIFAAGFGLAAYGAYQTYQAWKNAPQVGNTVANNIWNSTEQQYLNSANRLQQQVEGGGGNGTNH